MYENFNVYVYKKIYSDISIMSDKEAINHYKNYGIKEGRISNLEKKPKDFDPNIYKKLNQDLKNLTDDEAIYHYIQHGIRENREYKISGISEKMPNEKNEDDVVNHIKTDTAMIKNTGNMKCKSPADFNVYVYEIPKDFNVEIYKLLNTDLYTMTDLNAMIHYVTYGCKENRQYNLKKSDDNIILKDKILIILSHGKGGGLSKYVVELLDIIHILLYDYNEYTIITNENYSKSNINFMNIIDIEKLLLSENVINKKVTIHINSFGVVKFDNTYIYDFLKKIVC